MSNYGSPFLGDQLSKRTFIFGLRLWVIVGVCVGAGFVLLLFLISLWIVSRRNRSLAIRHHLNQHTSKDAAKSVSTPVVSKEIQEIRIDSFNSKSHALNVPLSESVPQTPSMDRQRLLPWQQKDQSPGLRQMIQIEIGKDHRILFPGSGSEGGGSSSRANSSEYRSGEQALISVPEVSHLGWGHWFTLRELELATVGFSSDRVIGEGGYGIVYLGVLEDNTQVAVKNLLNNRLS